MRSKSAVSRPASSLLIALSLLISASAAHAHPVQTAPGALGSSMGQVWPTHETPILIGVDQWDNDIVKLRVGPGSVQVLSEESTGAHFFSFDLAVATTVTIAVTGPTGLNASLYGEDGMLLAAEARGTQALAAGRYFVRVEGALEDSEVTITGRPQ